MKLTVQATLHFCDGCAREVGIQLDADDLPSGIFANVTEIGPDADMIDTGALFVCSEACLLPAFKRRREVWTRR